jgi:hypothetical protein
MYMYANNQEASSHNDQVTMTTEESPELQALRQELAKQAEAVRCEFDH